MKAAAIDRFGGPEVFRVQSLPVPEPAAREILIRLDAAGIGVWDPEVREGELGGVETRFPHVIGNDGAGTVVAVGDAAMGFHIGDRVYAFTMDGGFYAEYVAVGEDSAALIPPAMTAREAGALGADGITALRGLQDHLHVAEGQKLMIVGASGGIGHIALQLAKLIGAKVLAVASGRDGVELVRRLGADAAVDGHEDDVAAAARAFAPGGLDVALVLASGRSLDKALHAVKRGGRIAYPNGVEPEPHAPDGRRATAYDGTPTPDAFDRLNALIGASPFHVEIGRLYHLEDAATAHQEIDRHHIGKLAFELRPA
jgi:NADPH:quinone reductase-like Zn-dependent oxidoreductase